MKKNLMLFTRHQISQIREKGQLKSQVKIKPCKKPIPLKDHHQNTIMMNWKVPQKHNLGDLISKNKYKNNKKFLRKKNNKSKSSKRCLINYYKKHKLIQWMTQ